MSPGPHGFRLLGPSGGCALETRSAYEAACAQLRALPRPWPRFLAAPGVAVAVLEVPGDDGQPCIGLVVEFSR